MELYFESKRSLLSRQFEQPQWIEDGSLSTEELEACVAAIEQKTASRALAKASTFDLLARRAWIAVDAEDIFQDKLMGGGIMAAQRGRWEKAVKEQFLAEASSAVAFAWEACGAYHAMGDYGHTSPNTRLLLSVGFAGLLERVENASAQKGLSDRQREFYDSCKIVLRACMTVATRLAKAIKPYNEENAAALTSIAVGAPKNTYEALQLLVLYFFLHEYVGGTRVRTLGRIDVLLDPFYRSDLANGTYTRSEIGEMLKFFLFKFWCAKVPFDLPFCLGGRDADGRDVTSEISYLIVQTYNELNIHSPKIHIRVSEKTPKDFVKLVLSCIRGGNSSFVLVNDRIGIESLLRVGIDASDAWDYVPIGCYEPAVWGVEIGCTGNGGVNLAKAVELVFNNGRDHQTGAMIGVETGAPTSFAAFLAAVKKQISHMTAQALSYIVSIERYYDRINPDPLLSCQYEHSVAVGKDVYEGGAKYNNSSLYFYSIASLVDSLCAVKRLVFEDGTYTLEELGAILRADWKDNARARAVALRKTEKYGNGDPVADALAVEMAELCATLVNNKPNGRGGVFKAALFSIDFCFHTGKRTMATPDGRHAGDPLSKNLCATVGMDKNGITALIHSVTQIDHADFPTGSVLDVLLHPSAVSGEDGLEAFYGILATYFNKGGFAMHGNVFDAAILKDAQAHPERYRTLQVRVCGWNAYFVNLSKVEQDAFIRQAEGNG